MLPKLLLACALVVALPVVPLAQEAPAPTRSAHRIAGGSSASPCRFQYRRSNGKWSHRLVSRSYVRGHQETHYRPAPKTRRFVPKFIGCLGNKYGVSIRHLLSTAWCESHYDPKDISKGRKYFGVWQFSQEWGPRNLLLDSYNSTRLAIHYIYRHGWGPWSCRNRSYIPGWALRSALVS